MKDGGPAGLVADAGEAWGAGARSGAPWTFALLVAGALVGTALLGLPLLVNALGVALQVTFFAFFARHLAFSVAALDSAPADLAAPLIETGSQPSVTVLVACKNEEAVAAVLITSLLGLDYPQERLQLVVVDDGSSDGTAALLDAAAAADPRLACLHRPPGAGGGKSGALNAALPLATGEIIVVFDADHRPRTDVVRRLVRHFADPAVAAAQGRCEISNPHLSPLARLVAIDYLAGYLVNEYGRQALFGLPAYGGANCAVRASTLRELGGWNPRSVTEDTDLTLRVHLAGWRVRYDVTAVDAEEAVGTVSRYWRQRHRWARGHQQAWRDYRRAVWQSRHLSRSQKVETTMFLLTFHLPVLAGLGLVVLALWLAGLVVPPDPLRLFLLWTLLFLGPLLELGAGLLVSRTDRREAFALAWFLPLFFISISPCCAAWVEGVAGLRSPWAKTARAGDAAPRGTGS
ncbi:MAG TPA: glycosyltransferase family 2 protein [Actinomycetota bacterium]|nr:glycosyltransferase family 2 protein [Actinomycetota bacterium]